MDIQSISRSRCLPKPWGSFFKCSDELCLSVYCVQALHHHLFCLCLLCVLVSDLFPNCLPYLFCFSFGSTVSICVYTVFLHCVHNLILTASLFRPSSSNLEWVSLQPLFHRCPILLPSHIFIRPLSVDDQFLLYSVTPFPDLALHSPALPPSATLSTSLDGDLLTAATFFPCYCLVWLLTAVVYLHSSVEHSGRQTSSLICPRVYIQHVRVYIYQLSDNFFFCLHKFTWCSNKCIVLGVSCSFLWLIWLLVIMAGCKYQHSQRLQIQETWAVNTRYTCSFSTRYWKVMLIHPSNINCETNMMGLKDRRQYHVVTMW